MDRLNKRLALVICISIFISLTSLYYIYISSGLINAKKYRIQVDMNMYLMSLDCEVSEFEVINGEITYSAKLGQNTNEIIKQHMCADNYLTVKMVNDAGKRVSCKVSRIIARMFIPNDNPEHKTQVNHIDGNKSNNHVSNLEWVTPSQNLQHAFDIGLRSKGSRRVYTEKDAHLVYSLLSKGYSMMRITRDYPLYTYSWVKSLYHKETLWAASIAEQYDY